MSGCNLSEGDCRVALDEALRARLLRENTAGGYLFTHDRIRDVAYAEAGDARRRAFHRRAFDALRKDGAPAVRLVVHATAAGLLEAAFDFSCAAGDHALRLLAARDAILHYEQAMTLAEQLGRNEALPGLRARRGQAFASTARWLEARRDFEAALPGLVAEERGAVLIQVAMGALALADSSDGELRDSLDRYAQAFTRAENQRSAALAPVAEMTGLILYWTAQHAEAIPRLREAIEIARGVNDFADVMRALGDLGLALGANGQYQEAIEAFEQARRFWGGIWH